MHHEISGPQNGQQFRTDDLIRRKEIFKSVDQYSIKIYHVSLRRAPNHLVTSRALQPETTHSEIAINYLSEAALMSCIPNL